VEFWHHPSTIPWMSLALGLLFGGHQHCKAHITQANVAHPLSLHWVSSPARGLAASCNPFCCKAPIWPQLAAQYHHLAIAHGPGPTGSPGSSLAVGGGWCHTLPGGAARRRHGGCVAAVPGRALSGDDLQWLSGRVMVSNPRPIWGDLWCTVFCLAVRVGGGNEGGGAPSGSKNTCSPHQHRFRLSQ